MYQVIGFAAYVFSFVSDNRVRHVYFVVTDTGVAAHVLFVLQRRCFIFASSRYCVVIVSKEALLM
jgi:hypothetical protein